jgi:hypothetical protein
MLHLNLAGGDQRVFRVNDNVTRFPLILKPTANCTCVLSRKQKDNINSFTGVTFARLQAAVATFVLTCVIGSEFDATVVVAGAPGTIFRSPHPCSLLLHRDISVECPDV